MKIQEGAKFGWHVIAKWEVLHYIEFNRVLLRYCSILLFHPLGSKFSPESGVHLAKKKKKKLIKILKIYVFYQVPIFCILSWYRIYLQDILFFITKHYWHAHPCLSFCLHPHSRENRATAEQCEIHLTLKVLLLIQLVLGNILHVAELLH